MKCFAAALLAAVFALGCSKEETTGAKATSAPEDGGTTEALTFGGERPATVRVPAGYDPASGRLAPLLLVLHGYGTGGVINDIYMKMTTIADAKGFFYLSPDGTKDKAGKLFWNATDACCDFDGSQVDDVAYLTSLVREVQAAYRIDPKRIYVMGHSNGGFMTNRLACDRADVFAAAVSFAGASWKDGTRCAPSEPVGFLQLHGLDDQTILFAGSPGAGSLGAYPSAEATVALWAEKNGCTGALTDAGTSLRVSADSPGADTRVSRHEGCRQNGAAELWPVGGARHAFSFTPEAVDSIWSFLEAHAKP
jgi:polyhydroxybutyrate depolymerase